MTIAVVASVRANRMGCPSTKNQVANVSTPAITATNTKISAALSARRCAGAFEFWATETSWTT